MSCPDFPAASATCFLSDGARQRRRLEAGESQMIVTADEIRTAARALCLSGRPLCIHSSLRSFGRVEGGAPALVAALLAEGCTVLVPTFSWSFAVPPTRRLPRNGWDYDAFPGRTSGIGRVYTPDAMEIDADMGTVP